MMANNAVKTPIFRAIASRSYSSQRINPISGTLSEVKTTVLPNNLIVASADTGSPITRLSVVFRAGSRYETSDNFGVSHTLRIAAGLSTKNATQFGITRNIQQVGANLSCTTDRELIAYTLTGTYDAVERGSEYLSEIACSQVFKPWELSDSLPRLKLELATLSPEVRAINFLHKVAFRNGLGNSMFCAKHCVGKISTETLQHYVAQNFTTNRAAVVGLGVDHNHLVAYAQNMTLESGSGSDCVASKYHSGEIRSEKGGDLAYIAVGTEGAKISEHKEALAFAILQRALGNGTYIKYGNESKGLLNKSVSSAVSNQPFAVSAMNVSYTDSGLFGFIAIAPSNVAADVVMKATEVLRSGNVSEDDVKRAKNQVKMAALLNMESGSTFIDEMANQAINTRSVHTPDQIIAAIDGISSADVNEAAKKIAKGKLSMASVGNLKCVPYLDELK